MNVEPQQGAGMPPRILRIETDPWCDPVKPRIRLHGRWLERAGFKPGHPVEVRLAAPGAMTLHFLEAPNGGQ